MSRPTPIPDMPRGRPRKLSAKIPAHIDQERIPRGLYFNPLGNGRWYMIVGGKKRYVAGAAAKLSDLHALVEDKPRANSLRQLVADYEAGAEYLALAKSTRTSYARSGKIVCDYTLIDATRLGDADMRSLTRPLFQRLIAALAKGTGAGPTPSKAAHVGRYLSVLTRWGDRWGGCPKELTGTFALPRERKDPRVPEQDAMAALIAYARQHGVTRGVKDSVAPYLWAVAEIAYRCRLRGVEVLDLTDASASAEGVRCERRKGSDPTLFTWSDELREAWDFLTGHRDALWGRRRRPVPMRADARPLVVSQSGDALTRRALTQAWGKLVTAGIAAGVITRRFGLHGIKHRGVTDTEGTRGQKREASGHRTEAMVARYDHAVPVVKSLGKIQKKPAENP